MDDPSPFFPDPADTREEILRATYIALCEHGYSNLSFDRIDEHYPKSKSSIYHYYDDKRALLVDFLQEMVDRYRRFLPTDDATDPAEELTAILDAIFAPEIPPQVRDYLGVIVELRSEVVNDAEFEAIFRRTDEEFHDLYTELVREGTDAGVFRDVDATEVGAHLCLVTQGVLHHRFTQDGAYLRAVRAELDTYLQERLYADGVDA